MNRKIEVNKVKNEPTLKERVQSEPIPINFEEYEKIRKEREQKILNNNERSYR